MQLIKPSFTEKDFGNQSFLRLTGGKQKLLANLIEVLPKSIGQYRYIEPFFGGGSLFFALAPEGARLNDANALLMDMYKFIEDDPSEVHRELINLARNHGQDFYYTVRSSFNCAIPSHKKAAQLIYLNRSCFNGVFRVNQKSEFNVPWGKKLTVVIPDLGTLERASLLFGQCQLLNRDFAGALCGVGEGDFVYLDPPYLPIDTTAFFRHYTWPRFDLDDHIRLSEYAHNVVALGASVMVSNPDLPIVRTMFRDWYFTELSIPRFVSTKKAHLRRAKELIITSYAVSGVKEWEDKL